MSSASTPIQPIGFLASWIAFVKAHERLVLIGVLAFLGYHFYGAALTAWVNHDKLIASQANVQVKQDDTQTIAIQQQLAALQKEITNQDALIAASISQRTQATAVQVKTDQTLPLPDLANRWASLLQLPIADFSAASGNSISVSSDASHVTVEQLEEVPTLTANNADLNKQIANLTQLNSKQTEAAQACSTELTDEKKAHADDVKALKAQNKKSWLNGFKWGGITGFVGGLFIGHSGL